MFSDFSADNWSTRVNVSIFASFQAAFSLVLYILTRHSSFHLIRLRSKFFKGLEVSFNRGMRPVLTKLDEPHDDEKVALVDIEKQG